jgi:hypothetical protein
MHALSRERMGWATVALLSALVLLLSRLLTPSVSGLGTHMQLGLPPCGFLALFHIPCPACGLTTSFAHLAHGSLGASLTAHPLGLPLFLTTAFVALRALFEAVRAQPSSHWLSNSRALACAWLYTASLLLVWLVRLSLGGEGGAKAFREILTAMTQP